MPLRGAFGLRAAARRAVAWVRSARSRVPRAFAPQKPLFRPREFCTSADAPEDPERALEQLSLKYPQFFSRLGGSLEFRITSANNDPDAVKATAEFEKIMGLLEEDHEGDDCWDETDDEKEAVAGQLIRDFTQMVREKFSEGRSQEEMKEIREDVERDILSTDQQVVELADEAFDEFDSFHMQMTMTPDEYEKIYDAREAEPQVEEVDGFTLDSEDVHVDAAEEVRSDAPSRDESSGGRDLLGFGKPKRRPMLLHTRPLNKSAGVEDDDDHTLLKRLASDRDFVKDLSGANENRRKPSRR